MQIQYGFSVVRSDIVVGFDWKPLTRWEKFRNACSEAWEMVILPALMLTASLTCFRIAIYFSFER